MRIVACDDDAKLLAKLAALLDEYKGPSGEHPKVDLFNNASGVLDALEKSDYDLALLDVLMPGLTGMDAAREIRSSNRQIKIVFLTSSREFAVESYRVNASDYLLKPVNKESLYSMLDRIEGEIGKAEDELHVNTTKSIFSIPYSKLEYLEINNRTLIFHLADKSEEEVVGRLSDFEETLLARPEFIKPHRSFIVNMDRIKTLETKEIVTLTGAVIPIARGINKEIRDAYMDHLFK